MQSPRIIARAVVPIGSMHRLAIAVLAAFSLAACTIGLVPAYDAELAEGLGSANKQTMILFAELEEGSPKTEADGFSKTYAEIIGSFEELRHRAASRPMPPLAAKLQKQRIFQTFCNSKEDPVGCLNASPASIAEVLSTIRMMRRTHRDTGLSPALVEGFERQYVTAVRQALTVESALKR